MTQQNPLERYEILHELGHGAIGRVYAARDRSTGAVVALKTLDPALFGEPDANFAELFLKDARSAARLRHRNIVKLHDAGEAGGTAYVAMELLEGESLRHMLDDRPLPIARAIQIFDDVASALAYAHEEGVVHRCVKPSSIIVLRSGVAKISDFGIGRLGEAALVSGQPGGCLSYMSPEQVRGDPVDHRSDLFSLGAVFYEMLTRRVPFEGNSPKEITQNILHAEPPLPSKVNPLVPFELDRIVFSMLAGHPDDRFANARILLRDLQRLEEGLGLGPGASAGGGEPTASVPPSGPSVPPRAQTQPAAPQPATEREPRLRTPDPNRFRDRAQRQDPPWVAEEFQHRSRIPGGEAFDDYDARFRMDREREPERSSGSRVAKFAALAFLLAVLPIGLAVLYYSPGPSESRIPASRVQEAPAPQRLRRPDQPRLRPWPKRPRNPRLRPLRRRHRRRARVVCKKRRRQRPGRPDRPRLRLWRKRPRNPRLRPLRRKHRRRAQWTMRERSKSRQASHPRRTRCRRNRLWRSPALRHKPRACSPASLSQRATAGTAPVQEVLRAAQPAANISKPQPGGTAKLIIAVAPQGELYIDGKHYGTTPPITTLDLEPGMYRIEIRSGSRKPYLTYMAVEAGDQRRIRHDFSAKSIRPPI